MPRLSIDLARIEDNTRLVAGLLAPYDVRLVGVTKACLGNWHIAGAMIAGGATALADSRTASIARLRRHIPETELIMLRSQVGGEPMDGMADRYYVSSVAQAEALLPLISSRPLRLSLVVETGDGRDGIVPEHAGAEAVRLAALPGVSVEGIATNVACAGNTTSLSEPLKRFREVGEAIARCLVPGQHGAGDDSHPNQMIFSAGGSGLLGLLLDESNTAGNSDTLSRLSELRCGEALLLGKIPRGTGGGLPLPEAHGDAFILDAPVLEVAVKQGRRQILVGLGIQDVGAGSLTPLSPALEVADATSDYLALVLTPSESSTDPLPEVGDRLAFIPSYHALLAAMTSPFVEKIFAGDRAHVNGLYPPEDNGSEDSGTES